jgi:hypothetical protein
LLSVTCSILGVSGVQLKHKFEKGVRRSNTSSKELISVLAEIN